MLDIVEKDYPITPRVVAHEDAVEHFKKSNRPRNVLLVLSNNDPGVRVVECNGYYDLFYRTLVARTGQLKKLDLVQHDEGFVLVDPHKRISMDDKLIQVYKNYKKWGEVTN